LEMLYIHIREARITALTARRRSRAVTCITSQSHTIMIPQALRRARRNPPSI